MSLNSGWWTPTVRSLYELLGCGGLGALTCQTELLADFLVVFSPSFVDPYGGFAWSIVVPVGRGGALDAVEAQQLVIAFGAVASREASGAVACGP